MAAADTPPPPPPPPLAALLPSAAGALGAAPPSAGPPAAAAPSGVGPAAAEQTGRVGWLRRQLTSSSEHRKKGRPGGTGPHRIGLPGRMTRRRRLVRLAQEAGMVPLRSLRSNQLQKCGAMKVGLRLRNWLGAKRRRKSQSALSCRMLFN